MITSAQFGETSVNVTNNSPSRDYSHPDHQTTQTTETHGYKQFTVSTSLEFSVEGGLLVSLSGSLGKSRGPRFNKLMVNFSCSGFSSTFKSLPTVVDLCSALVVDEQKSK